MRIVIESRLVTFVFGKYYPEIQVLKLHLWRSHGTI